MGTQPNQRPGRGSTPLVLSDFTDNPNSTTRRKRHSRWESNPHLPEINSGVLSQLKYRVMRWARGTADTALRKRNRTYITELSLLAHGHRRLSHGEQPPLRLER